MIVMISQMIIYVNDLPNATNILDPIMFADDTNLFYSHHDIKTLFSTVNEELEKLGDWFTANRLSLNIKKTKYTFFHKNSVKDNIPLKLPDLHISNKSIERKSSIKFLGVMLDEQHQSMKDILIHSRPLLRSLNALNIYQINLCQHGNLIYKFKKCQAPKIFNMTFEKRTHKYPTQFKYKKIFFE